MNRQTFIGIASILAAAAAASVDKTTPEPEAEATEELPEVGVDPDADRADADRALADAIIDKLSQKARARILQVSKIHGASRKGRRATMAIIARDATKTRLANRRDEHREKAKQARLADQARRVSERGAPLPGMSAERVDLLASVSAALEDREDA